MSSYYSFHIVLYMFLIKDVAAWLKRIRLHKYSLQLSNYTFEEMLQLNDESLLNLEFTVGAKDKLIRELDKLRNTPNILRDHINVFCIF